MKAIDDKTLEVTLKAPTPWFVKTAGALDPVRGPAEAMIEKFGVDWIKPENIVSNGAYILAENSPGERVAGQAQPELLEQRQDRDRGSPVPRPSMTRTRA